jgi:hypothetical protein
MVQLGRFCFTRRLNGSVEIRVGAQTNDPSHNATLDAGVTPELDVSIVVTSSDWALLVADLSGTPGPRTFELAKALHD